MMTHEIERAERLSMENTLKARAEEAEREHDEARKAWNSERTLWQSDYDQLERERDEARMALKAVGACPTFDCDDCRELLEVALREVKE